MKILFLCTANSCRSILSEAVFNHLAPPGLHAYSAGSHPRRQVNPLSLRALERAGIATAGLYSKSVEELADLNPDIVITVCDRAAGEACPLFLSHAVKAHWGLADPSECEGTPEQIEQAFAATMVIIRARIQAFLSLSAVSVQADTLTDELARIGETGPDGVRN